MLPLMLVLHYNAGADTRPGGCHLIHPSATRQCCSVLWLWGASDTGLGERRECASHGVGAALSHLLVHPQVVSFARETASVHPPCPFCFLRLK